MKRRKMTNFNPRSLAGATTQLRLNQQSSKFQSTLPRGSDPGRRDILTNSGYFNPRSLAGATFCFGWPLVSQTISIHAPSRERREVQHYYPYGKRISIHAPSRERPWTDEKGADLAYISIHAPSRERPLHPNQWTKTRQISIHAPSRERPFLVSTVIPFIQISIHAPSRERPLAMQDDLVNMQFQSTLPRGSDVTTPSLIV